jgi:hypothetical protein
MQKVQFKDVKINQTFIMDNKEYLKIEEKRISCCKFTNACLKDNTNHKLGIKPLTEVEINDQL